MNEKSILRYFSELKKARDELTLVIQKLETDKDSLPYLVLLGYLADDLFSIAKIANDIATEAENEHKFEQWKIDFADWIGEMSK